MSSALPSASGPILDASPPPLPPDSVYTSCYCEENIYLLAQTFTRLSGAHSTDTLGSSWPWQIYVVFISNGGKTVVLWSQKAARDGGWVVWDYHVVLVLLPRTPHDPGRDSHAAPSLIESQGPGSRSEWPPEQQAWVYDFDTTLPVPCPWRADYIAGTFPYALDRSLADRIDERFHSLFRVIPAGEFLDHFASDRSHMIVPVHAVAPEVQAETLEDGGGSDARSGSEGSAEARADGPRYAQPPPPYPPLRGEKARAMGIVHNLMESFVAMDLRPAPLAEESAALREGEAQDPRSSAARYGQVMNAEAFVRWLAGSEKEA
ncbi:hypothetical protein OH77DRAFT_1413760 [Trametes cingulata]|nr:hypothetical protein OH77DRAFT_1413760 [Trametes cingulata]